MPTDIVFIFLNNWQYYFIKLICDTNIYQLSSQQLGAQLRDEKLFPLYVLLQQSIILDVGGLKNMLKRLKEFACSCLCSVFICGASLFFLTPSWASGQDASFTIGTWNAALINQPVSALDLQDFVNEVDFDVLLVNEIKKQSDLEKMKQGMRRDNFFTTISSFSNGDGNLEVGIISRFPLTNIVEFDQSIDGAVNGVTETTLKVSQIPGVANRNVGRGFLVAQIPDLNTFVIVSHFKSSRGRSGPGDFNNAEKRELVAVAVAEEVNALLLNNPNSSIIFGGDVNVGATDATKNGTSLTNDRTDGYDDTHAILSDGLIGGLRMRSLVQNIGPTFIGGNFGPTGAIDVLYVEGALKNRFADAQSTTQGFGSDHLAVYATVGNQTGGGNGSNSHNGGTTGQDVDLVQITNALPNPLGADPSQERVVLTFNGNGTLDISDWKLRDLGNNIYTFPSGTQLQPGDNDLTLFSNTMPLNNNGDEIIILDDNNVQRGQSFSYSGGDIEPGEFVF